MTIREILPNLKAVRFPDDGPNQSRVAQWVRGNGGEAHLYDGEVIEGIETSTNANWRWTKMHLKVCVINVGDWIAYDGTDVFKLPLGSDLCRFEHATILLVRRGYDVLGIPPHGGEPEFIKRVATIDEADDVVSNLT